MAPGSCSGLIGHGRASDSPLDVLRNHAQLDRRRVRRALAPEELRDAAGVRRTQHTDDSGAFTFYNLAQEPYRIEVRMGPPGTPPLLAEGVFPDGPLLELVAEQESPEPTCAGATRSAPSGSPSRTASARSRT